MKTNFSSDDHLPLKKTLKLHYMKIIVRAIFNEDSKL